jgi:hypothetical protein
MEDIKALQLQLIQAILACADPAVLRTALQLVQRYAQHPDAPSPSDQALVQVLLEAPGAPTTAKHAASWDDEAVAEVQRSIDEIFGGS